MHKISHTDFVYSGWWYPRGQIKQNRECKTNIKCTINRAMTNCILFACEQRAYREFAAAFIGPAYNTTTTYAQ